ncbi:hypothetical protein D7Z26_12575 [Cohnella endophytica]|uniref:GerMN domain-containing protein n=1 Tax=Cohnella endophytica TaxID=2419778 RepID=A0A494XUF1_9BACL|nr:GerMN domain-containing protein [Cohnella endophytica]RKP54200.1 hypothetical protein D7Z26_12575 [Cohnella endophytica]
MEIRSYRGKWFKKWPALLLLLPLLSACSQTPVANKDVSASIDPPPSDIEQAMLNGTSTRTLSQNDDVVTVYLLDSNGYLAPMSLKLDADSKSSESPVQKAIAWMTVNKQLADQLPPGFQAVLPAGTKLNKVTENKAQQTISVDFAAPLPGIEASQERKVIEALVWTLTELPGINKARLSVGGKPIRSLPASGLPVDTVLTRGLGINVEAAANVEINRSMGVTLYFSAQSKDGEGYFVPVTRLVNRQVDPSKAALEQLIAGPKPSSALKAVLTSDMTIEKLGNMADTVQVSLKSDDWMPESPVPSEMMEALVLTLTEASGKPQVQVAMNGNDSLVDSANRTYDHPVTRPAIVNALSR